MGVCASSQVIKENSTGGNTSRPTLKIIHVEDGRLQEFKQPIVARHILSRSPNAFLCSLESINLDQHMPQVDETEELQVGQMYLLLPLSHSQTPLSLSDLCALTIKASAVLRKHGKEPVYRRLPGNVLSFRMM